MEDTHSTTRAGEEIYNLRQQKLKSLADAGVTIYPDRYPDALPIRTVIENPEEGCEVRTAGRLISMRKMGKLIFAHIQDISGKIQIALQKKIIGENAFNLFKNFIDIGDVIGVSGKLFVTRTGELTVDTHQHAFLAKSFHPLPEKWHGLTDTESIYRQRYLDLIMSDRARTKFLVKSKLIQVLREKLLENDFIEVETPVLQSKPSGALAKPFKTYHEALNMDVFLRIAPETYLKRLIVGGFTRVFEFARCFRNEGISPEHLQDFTMLEYYVAYWNYEDNITFTEDIFHELLNHIQGSQTIKLHGQTLDFSGSWPRLSFRELIERDSRIDINDFEDSSSLLKEICQQNIDLQEDPKDLAKMGRGNLIDLLYKRVSRPKLIQPVFLVGHPVDLSPLARSNDDHPRIVDRFQLVAGGTELVNAYSELADPIEQKRRLEEQAKLKAAGDCEALTHDEDFVEALEYGMPPASGWGMGIDRFLKFLFEEENIKNCVLFPLMKPKAQ